MDRVGQDRGLFEESREPLFDAGAAGARLMQVRRRRPISVIQPRQGTACDLCESRSRRASSEPCRERPTRPETSLVRQGPPAPLMARIGEPRSGVQQGSRCRPMTHIAGRAAQVVRAVPVIEMAAVLRHASHGRERRLQPLYGLKRPDPSEVPRARYRQQIRGRCLVGDVRWAATDSGASWKLSGGSMLSAGVTKVSKKRHVCLAIRRRAQVSASASGRQARIRGDRLAQKRDRRGHKPGDGERPQPPARLPVPRARLTAIAAAPMTNVPAIRL